MLPVLRGAEEGHPGVEAAAVGAGRQVHGFRETGEEQLEQLRPTRTHARTRTRTHKA